MLLLARTNSDMHFHFECDVFLSLSFVNAIATWAFFSGSNSDHTILGEKRREEKRERGREEERDKKALNDKISQ